MDRISEQALEVLQGATVSSRQIKLRSGQISRELYNEVNEVLSRLGGKWNRNEQAHLFPFEPGQLLQAVISGGEMPPDNPTAFFPTPSNLVNSILDPNVDSSLSIAQWEDARILEPSAGMGAIAKRLREIKHPDATLHVCEFLPMNKSLLEADGFTVVADDFLKYVPDAPYDLIAMNPPFSVEGDSTAFITHIEHAWGMLANNGYLIAICPTGFLTSTTKRQSAFMDFVCTYGTFEFNPKDAFKESGTLVSTCTIFVKKVSQDWRSEPYNGWPNWYCWSLSLWEGNEYKFYQSKEQLFDKLTKGELPLLPDKRTSEEIRRHYKPIIDESRKHGEMIVMDEASWEQMELHFIEEWLEHKTYNELKS